MEKQVSHWILPTLVTNDGVSGELICKDEHLDQNGYCDYADLWSDLRWEAVETPNNKELNLDEIPIPIPVHIKWNGSGEDTEGWLVVDLPDLDNATTTTA